MKLHTVYAVISEAIKPLQLVGQVPEFKFESKFEPPVCRSSGDFSRRLFQKTIEGFDCKKNGQALGPALLLLGQILLKSLETMSGVILN